jgi:hypothetical protein
MPDGTAIIGSAETDALRIPESDLKDLRKQLPGCWVR